MAKIIRGVVGPVSRLTAQDFIDLQAPNPSQSCTEQVFLTSVLYPINATEEMNVAFDELVSRMWVHPREEMDVTFAALSGVLTVMRAWQFYTHPESEEIDVSFSALTGTVIVIRAWVFIDYHASPATEHEEIDVTFNALSGTLTIIRGYVFYTHPEAEEIDVTFAALSGTLTVI